MIARMFKAGLPFHLRRRLAATIQHLENRLWRPSEAGIRKTTTLPAYHYPQLHEVYFAGLAQLTPTNCLFMPLSCILSHGLTAAGRYICKQS